MTRSSTLKMPEWLMLGRTILLGFFLAEAFHVGFLSAKRWGWWLFDNEFFGLVIVGATFIVSLLIAYGFQRETHLHASRVLKSRRYDLGLLLLSGVWLDVLLGPQLKIFHDAVSQLDDGWSQAALTTLFVILATPIFRPILTRPRTESTQLRFVSDIELNDSVGDSLEVAELASNFADTVLTSATSSGMVFGVDAPWGTGKTSFLNIASKRWADVATNTVIVFKFEPLRYASEPDLAERFIRELCTRIRQEVFAPEFLPAANRYSRMLKGKTDVTFLGVKLSLEPSAETLDELLGDIDEVLEQVGRRLIVIVDDLDRLEPKLVNNVLFTVRRTFKLSRAAYILCYDTEVLVAGKEEGSRAREFLEKFITTKLSLFVDLKTVQDFLNKDWRADPSLFPTIPADVMFKLSQVTGAAAQLLGGKKAHHYIPLLGDLRKIKRFVNAALLLNFENVDLSKSDFHPPDLVHLLLLNIGYPGIFRQIYAEETEGRTGSFSIQRGERSGLDNMVNSPDFSGVLENSDKPATFLLKQLFDTGCLDFSRYPNNSEEVWRTRACFNQEGRNLENYLKLIVRLKVPEAIETFRMYQELLTKIMAGELNLAEVLSSGDFALPTSQNAHERLWQLVVNNAHRFNSLIAVATITTLISWLPRYSIVGSGDRSMRQRLIYSLLLLLDRSGFGEPRGDRIRSSSDVLELAELILGKKGETSRSSLIRKLTAPKRGPLGFEDVMLARLSCCADRLGQVHNIYTALLRYEDTDARAEGDVEVITRNSMRRFSQQVFREFKDRYISGGVNFFTEVDRMADAAFLGEFSTRTNGNDSDWSVEAARSGVKSFVIYQLTNRLPPTGSGVGCGLYDEDGSTDGGGIHTAMCRYLLDFCFNPTLGKQSAFAFADFCLRAFRDEAMRYDGNYDVPTSQTILTSLLGKDEIAGFWRVHGDAIKSALAGEGSRVVVSYNFRATYEERLPLVILALDGLLSSDSAVSGEGLDSKRFKAIRPAPR